MNMTKYMLLIFTSVLMLVSSQWVIAEDRWFVRAHLGYSQVSDQSASASNVEVGAASLDAPLDAGFTSGLGVGYQINSTWAAEFSWEYRTNDATVTLDNGSVFSDGNYASNIFYVNGIYTFSQAGLWQPYAGFGLTWVQEIDIDLETEGAAAERSFADSGYTGYQIFTGVNRPFSESWIFQAEVRYGSISSIDLEEEGGTGGRLTGFDYNPLTLQLGLGYRF